jgi:hypothetical protein
MATTNEDKKMLTMPAYESLDEDIGYFGWTENISLFTRRSLESPLNMKPHGGAATRKRQPHLLLQNSSELLDKYTAPLPMACKFNSLRSGPFGATDPFIQSLFAHADFTPQADTECQSSMVELETWLQQLADVGSTRFGDAMEMHFAEPAQAGQMFKVDIPGDMNPSLRALDTRAEKSSGFMPTINRRSASAQATILPFAHGKLTSEDAIGDCIDESPFYEFPGKYGNSRRTPKLQKHFLLAPAYRSTQFDYMHI